MASTLRAELAQKTRELENESKEMAKRIVKEARKLKIVEEARKQKKVETDSRQKIGAFIDSYKAANSELH